MRKIAMLCLDLALVAVATIVALLLRNNFYLSGQEWDRFLPYLVFSVALAAVALPLLGVHRAVWRYTAVGDYLRIATASAVIVIGALAAGFAYNRLEGVARAMPIIQFILLTMLLVGVRVVKRVRHAHRTRPARAPNSLNTETAREAVLLVGLSTLTELYLRALAELAPGRIDVAGLLGREDRHEGFLVHKYPVLGTPEKIRSVLRNLEVHGVFIDRIVVTTDPDRLSAEARQALLDVEESGIRVDFLTQSLGLGVPLARDVSLQSSGSVNAEAGESGAAFRMPDDALDALSKRPYWKYKRLFDLVLAATMIVVLSPLMIMVAILVALDVGLPIAFWQQRPGIRGQPLRLYKFRTMSAAHDTHGHRISDEKRLSKIGRFLRRARLDELPQLFSILVGDMSFVGPRPLLPVDQPRDYTARLVIRPGLTGWAQVFGGREISPADKAALDVWYVYNASLTLDFGILVRTLAVLFKGERTNHHEIQRAWRELREAGLYTGDLLEWDFEGQVVHRLPSGATRAA